MTDKRITALPAASTISEDDFLVVDSATAGTRKYQANTLIAAAAAAQSPVLGDWSQAAAYIHAGLGPVYFTTGSQAVEDWTTYASSSSAAAEYSMPFDVVEPDATGTLETGEELPVVLFQSHYCLPFDTPFSPYQAFLYAIDGLPAGTYNVTMGFSWGTNVVNGKTYQFTLANALPAGGQLSGFEGAPDKTVSNWRVKAWSSQAATTATEEVTLTEGSAGTSLGTFTVAGAQVVPASGTPATAASVTIGGTTYSYYGLNSLHRVAYGNNRWLHSPIRQYLNSFGYNWWSPATVFDRPPAYASRIGFLSGFSDDFVAHLKPIARKTALNYVSDGGTSAVPEYDTTYDRFVLPSGLEHNLQGTASYGGTQGEEGPAWPYWQRVAGSTTPLAWSTWGNTSTYHPEYVQYDLAAHTTARLVWLRSAYRGGGGSVAYVDSAGYCSLTYAVGGYRVAPACAIG